MENLFFLGRVLVGGYFIMSGYNHLAHPGHLTGYAASKGVPSPKLAILGSGVLILLGGLSILTGVRPELGVAAIVLFLLPVTFIMHSFWKHEDPMTRMSDRINFMKNIALLGSALMFLAISTPWPFSL